MERQTAATCEYSPVYPAGMSALELEMLSRAGEWARGSSQGGPRLRQGSGCTPGGGEAAGHTRRKDTLSRGDGEGKTFA